MDDISAKEFKIKNDVGEGLTHVILLKICTTGEWSQHCNNYFPVSLYEKGSPIDCVNHRISSLIPHFGNVCLTIINKSLKFFCCRNLYR